MRYKRKDNQVVKILFLLLLLAVGIGYAYLTSNLSITGSTSLAGNTWDIHFANVQVASGSVTATTPATIDVNDNTSINYTVVLEHLGDYYEFTVDMVNSGTLPGKITLVDLSGITPGLENVIDYSIVYTNRNIPVSVDDILNGGATKNIRVRVYYKEDIEEDDLLDTDVNLNITFDVTFNQSSKDEFTTDTIIQQLKTENSSCFTKYNGEVTDRVGETVTASNVYFDKCENKRNIIFNNMCWQMIRTTETGGIKMVYNGEAVSGKCEGDRTDHKGIVSGTYGTFVHYISGLNINEEFLYSTSFTYDTTTNEFTLVNPFRATWSDSTYEDLIGKFTCLGDTDTCTTIYNMSFYLSANDAFLVDYSIENTNYAGIGKSTFNAYYGNPIYSSYMFNKIYNIGEEELLSGALMGNDISYSNGTYTLLPADGESTLGTTKDNYHHYTCNSSSATCSKVRFYYTNDEYVELEGGANADDALNEMLYNDNVNRKNSSIKGVIDSWFAQNMLDKTNRLEDTVFCNNRTITNQTTYGWNKNGILGEHIHYKNEEESVTNMTCSNLTDQFSVSNNKAKLTYPVGLIQSEEVENLNTPSLLATGEPWYTISPTSFSSISAGARSLDADGNSQSFFVGIAYDVRPVVSLASGNAISSGTGSETDPWVVE